MRFTQKTQWVFSGITWVSEPQLAINSDFQITLPNLLTTVYCTRVPILSFCRLNQENIILSTAHRNSC